MNDCFKNVLKVKVTQNSPRLLDAFSRLSAGVPLPPASEPTEFELSVPALPARESPPTPPLSSLSIFCFFSHSFCISKILGCPESPGGSFDTSPLACERMSLTMRAGSGFVASFLDADLVAPPAALHGEKLVRLIFLEAGGASEEAIVGRASKGIQCVCRVSVKMFALWRGTTFDVF